MKWIKRILLGFVGLIGLVVLLLVGSIGYSLLFVPDSSEYTNVSW